MRRRSSRSAPILGGALAILALVLLLGPLAPSHGAGSGAPSGFAAASNQPADSAFTARVTFQGTGVANHTSTANPIAASFGNVFTTVFNWSTPSATLVTKGELIVFFLGAVIGVSSTSISGAVPRLSGTINLSSDLRSDQDPFEGVYQVQASLFDLGHAIWNTTFYVWIQAPGHITIINIALVIIGFFEIYQIAALGSVRVARKQMGIETPPKREDT